MAESIPHIPLLRKGIPYTSINTVGLCDHRDGKAIASISQANAGLIVRDILDSPATRRSICEKITTREAIDICEAAAEHFLNDTLPIGDHEQTPEDFVRCQSATTAMPQEMCRLNMQKIYKAMKFSGSILDSLTTNLDTTILDKGYGTQHERMTSFLERGTNLGVILPNNSPGVHALWIPAIVLRMPLILKPGGQEPWTPYRVLQALLKAGYPPEGLGYYPTGHGPVSTIMSRVDRVMTFGDESTVNKWAGDPRVEVHGPGYSKIILDDEASTHWEDYLDIMVQSIAANGGRSCINCSSVWTASNGKALAEALGQKLAEISPCAIDAPNAQLAGFSMPRMAEMINNVIESGLDTPGATDMSAPHRNGDRLTEVDGTTFLQPTALWIDDDSHPLAGKEFLFPFATVREIPTAQMADKLESTLVCTVITSDPDLQHQMLTHPNINRLNFGPIATPTIDWNQPHEGNLFDFLFERRAFQLATTE